MPVQNLADIDCEERVLWLAIDRPTLLTKFSVEAFYNSSNKLIYRRMVEQFENGCLEDGKIDIVALRNSLTDLDGQQLIRVLQANRIPFGEKMAIAVLKDRTNRRLLSKLSQQLEQGLEDLISPAKIDEITIQMREISHQLNGSKERQAFSTVDDIDRYYDEFMEEKENGSRLSLGFPSVDDLLNGGLVRKSLTTLAALTGQGKTNMLLGIVRAQVDLGLAYKTLIISGEMGWKELCDRWVYRNLDFFTPPDKMTDKQVEQFVSEISEVTRYNAIVQDKVLDLSGIEQEIILAKARLGGLDQVFVDYIQLMQASVGRSRYEDVGQLTRGLKRLAQVYDVRIVQLAQLNREVEKRADKRPKLSDLRESGSIEQDSNYVFFIHRPHKFDEEADPREAQIILEKNRHGPSGMTTLSFYKGNFYDNARTVHRRGTEAF